MKWTDLIRLSFTNLWRRKTRTILTMIGIGEVGKLIVQGLVIFVVVAVQSMVKKD